MRPGVRADGVAARHDLLDHVGIGHRHLADVEEGRLGAELVERVEDRLGVASAAGRRRRSARPPWARGSAAPSRTWCTRRTARPVLVSISTMRDTPSAFSGFLHALPRRAGASAAAASRSANGKDGRITSSPRIAGALRTAGYVGTAARSRQHPLSRTSAFPPRRRRRWSSRRPALRGSRLGSVASPARLRPHERARCQRLLADGELAVRDLAVGLRVVLGERRGRLLRHHVHDLEAAAPSARRGCP